MGGSVIGEGSSLLTLLVFLPLIGAILLVLPIFQRPADEEDDHGHGHDEHATPAKSSPAAMLVRGFAFLVTAATFAVSLVLFFQFDRAKTGFQFQTLGSDGHPIPWMTLRNITLNYHLGIDGISLLLVLLTTFLSMLSVGFSFGVKKRIKEYMVFLLVLETAMLGVFCALDLVLFYIFYEAVLIPMYFLIGIWGHEKRIYAAVKFFLYTFAGSVFMLIGILFIYWNSNTFSIPELMNPATKAHLDLFRLDGRTLMYLYSAFALAFMIKVPMFPFHTWLPDAHVEAPTAGSVILAGIMLKMGVYGFLRICLPIFPRQMMQSAPLFLTLAVIGIVYGAIVAAMQPDMKKLVAYSSVSHMGFVILGIFSVTPLGITGAVLQSINHGVSTGMLFFIVGMLYDRRHTRDIAAFGGIKRAVPLLSAFFLIALLSSVALPLTNGFVGEFTILQGSYVSDLSGPGFTAIASLGMVLSAVYMLWMFQRVFTGPLNKAENRHLPDLNMREKLVLAPLVVLVFWFGCYVTSWTGYLQTPISSIFKILYPQDTPEQVRARGVSLPGDQNSGDRAIKTSDVSVPNGQRVP